MNSLRQRSTETRTVTKDLTRTMASYDQDVIGTDEVVLKRRRKCLLSNSENNYNVPMHLCYAICITVVILAIPCAPCTWGYREYLKEDIPGLTPVLQFQTNTLCQYGCMRHESCVAYSWQHSQKKCCFLTDGTKLSNRQRSADTDLYIMTGRCNLPKCHTDNPCENGGTCQVATTGYTFLVCDCLPDYSGSWCQRSLLDVDPPQITVVPLPATSSAAVDVPPTTSTDTSIALYVIPVVVALLFLPIGAFIVYKLRQKKGAQEDGLGPVQGVAGEQVVDTVEDGEEFKLPPWQLEDVGKEEDAIEGPTEQYAQRDLEPSSPPTSKHGSPPTSASGSQPGVTDETISE
ncbi:hypothetical protein LSAT2_032620 [Lamellibrachia satsuma]|nr:hypothetical protein LSAT2_032620 [Lamellibrachia satsuma]